MFNNIGKKIKTLAQVITLIGIIASLITGIVFIALANNNPGWGTLGVLIIIIGSLISWISSFILYGFGQLVDNSDKLVQAHGISVDYPEVALNSPYEKLANLENLRAKGLITEEEYQIKKNNL